MSHVIPIPTSRAEQRPRSDQSVDPADRTDAVYVVFTSTEATMDASRALAPLEAAGYLVVFVDDKEQPHA